MRTKRFITSWILTTGITLLANWLFTHLGGYSEAEFKLLTGGTLFFSLFCIGLYYLARTQTSRKRSGTFMGLFMVSILVKFSGAILFLVAYQNKYNTIPREIVMFFILIYVVFLIYETWFMMVLGKQTD